MSYLHIEGIQNKALRVQHVQALSDGQYFLDSLGLLKQIDIEPYCRRCAKLELDPRIQLTTHEDEHIFRCGHTSGWVKRTEPLELQPLLTALGWDLRCVRCLSILEADNGKTDQTFLVTCPCTIRAMANPLAAPHATPSKLSAMVRVGGSELT